MRTRKTRTDGRLGRVTEMVIARRMEANINGHAKRHGKKVVGFQHTEWGNGDVTASPIYESKKYPFTTEVAERDLKTHKAEMKAEKKEAKRRAKIKNQQVVDFGEIERVDLPEGRWRIIVKVKNVQWTGRDYQEEVPVFFATKKPAQEFIKSLQSSGPDYNDLSFI